MILLVALLVIRHWGTEVVTKMTRTDTKRARSNKYWRNKTTAWKMMRQEFTCLREDRSKSQNALQLEYGTRSWQKW